MGRRNALNTLLALLNVGIALLVFRVNGIDSSAQLDVQEAKGLAARGNFGAAIATLDKVLTALPNDDEAKLLRAQWQEQLRAAGEEAQRQQVVAKREQRPREYFKQWMNKTLNSQLFAEQEIKVGGTSADVEARLLRALTNDQPIFKIQTLAFPKGELFCIQAIQDMGANGWRRCDLVGGETSNGEVTLMFKIFEYAYLPEFRLDGGPGTVKEEDMVPIHPSRVGNSQSFLLSRREEGVGLMRLRILGVTQD